MSSVAASEADAAQVCNLGARAPRELWLRDAPARGRVGGRSRPERRRRGGRRSRTGPPSRPGARGGVAESGRSGLQPESGDGSHPRLNVRGTPIANKYGDGKVKRTPRGGSKALEIVEGEAHATDGRRGPARPRGGSTRDRRRAGGGRAAGVPQGTPGTSPPVAGAVRGRRDAQRGAPPRTGRGGGAGPHAARGPPRTREGRPPASRGRRRTVPFDPSRNTDRGVRRARERTGGTPRRGANANGGKPARAAPPTGALRGRPSPSVRVGTRKVVIYPCARRSRGKLRWRPADGTDVQIVRPTRG